MLGNGSDDTKPLFKVWSRLKRDEGMEDRDIWDRVEMVRLSRSGEWIIVEGCEASGLIKANSEQGKTFWNELKQFEGKGKALMMVQSRNRWGFDIEIDAGEVGYWEQVTESQTVLYSKTRKPYDGSMENVTWNKVNMNVSPESVSNEKPGKNTRA